MAVDITRKVPPGDRFYQWYGKCIARAPHILSQDSRAVAGKRRPSWFYSRQEAEVNANEACDSCLHRGFRNVGSGDFGVGAPRFAAEFDAKKSVEISRGRSRKWNGLIPTPGCTST